MTKYIVVFNEPYKKYKGFDNIEDVKSWIKSKTKAKRGYKLVKYKIYKEMENKENENN